MTLVEKLDAWLVRMNRIQNLALVFFAGMIFMLVIFIACYLYTGGK
jgi:hypothetical protein